MVNLVWALNSMVGAQIVNEPKLSKAIKFITNIKSPAKLKRQAHQLAPYGKAHVKLESMLIAQGHYSMLRLNQMHMPPYMPRKEIKSRI